MAAGLENVSWSGLPQELLDLILNRVKDPIDVLRCRSVCTSWSMSPSLLQTYRKYFPLCLIQRGCQEKEERCFLSISSNETCKIHLPEEKGRSIYCFSNGWLLTMDFDTAYSYTSHQMRLLHVFTRAQITLPPISKTFRFRTLQVHKAIVSTCPCNTSNLAILLHYNESRVGFWREGDESWTSVCDTYFWADIMLYKSQFYGVDTWGKIFCFQLNLNNAKAPPTYISSLDHLKYRKHLVESAEGDFLLVAYHLYDDRRNYANLSNIEIYKLDLTSKAWEEVNDLRGQTLVICEGLCACVPNVGFSSAKSKYHIDFDQVGSDSFRLNMHSFEIARTRLLYYSYGKKLLPLLW